MRASILVAASLLSAAIAAEPKCNGGACPAKTGNKTATQAKNTVAKPEENKKDESKKEESKTDESSKKDTPKNANTPAKKPTTGATAKEGEKKVETVEGKNGAASTAFSVAALGFVAVLALAAL